MGRNCYEVWTLISLLFSRIFGDIQMLSQKSSWISGGISGFRLLGLPNIRFSVSGVFLLL
jgi:hypothetical protein